MTESGIFPIRGCAGVDRDRAAGYVRAALKRAPAGGKICRACLTVRPIAEFIVDKRAFGGRRHTCMPCRAARRAVGRSA